MESLKPPQTLGLDGNVAENWRRWIQRFKLFLCASEKDRKPEKLQCALLLHCADERAQELFNTFTFTDEEVDKIEPLITKFEDYCTPKKNTTYERHIFNNRVQKPDEPIDQFVTDLRILVKNCEYGELRDGIIRDRIIEGIRDNDNRRKLLSTYDLTLDKCIDICRVAECTQRQMQSFSGSTGNSNVTVEYVSAVTQKGRGAHAQRDGQSQQERRNYQSERRNVNTERENMVDCKYCGQTHARRRCPAYGKSCYKCNKSNHFAKVCKSKLVQELQEYSDSEEDISLEMYAINIDEVTSTAEGNAWYVTMDIRDNKVRFKIDTAAQANAISKQLARKIKKSYPFHIRQSRKRLTGYGGGKLNVVGKSELPCSFKGKTYMCEFSIVDMPNAEPILGLRDCERLDIVRLVRSVEVKEEHPILEEYKDVFKGIGCLAEPYHIQTDPGIKPVVHAPRKVPLTLTNKLKDELQRMEKLKVITKVDGPTDWVNSMVIVEKPTGKLRLCLDPKELNAAIRRQHFQILTIDEIMSKLAEASYFSALDASSGYWQIALTEESSHLTTFNTPFGRYKYLRLPFGINSAQEVFHKRMAQLFEDIEGVVTFVEDLLI